jgi:IS30 family transposase
MNTVLSVFVMGKRTGRKYQQLTWQHIPEGADFDDFNRQQIKDIQYKINNRP